MQDNYEFHEIANIFPMMSNDDFSSLKEDIKNNGQINPIFLHENKIIDGRNRYRACCELEILPVFENWDGQGSLVDFVLGLNLIRRHLDTGQKAAIALSIMPMQQAEAKERQRLAGGNHGNQYIKVNLPVSAGLRQPANEEENNADALGVEKKIKLKAVEVAAKAVGVGSRTVEEYRRIAKVAPERIDDIKQGKKTITATIKELKEEGVIVPIRKENDVVKEKTIKESDIKYDIDLVKDRIAKKLAQLDSIAIQYSKMAIMQLKSIPDDDSRVIEALTSVKQYVDDKINSIGCKK